MGIPNRQPPPVYCPIALLPYCPTARQHAPVAWQHPNRGLVASQQTAYLRPALIGRFLPRLGPPASAVRPFFCCHKPRHGLLAAGGQTIARQKCHLLTFCAGHSIASRRNPLAARSPKPISGVPEIGRFPPWTWAAGIRLAAPSFLVARMKRSEIRGNSRPRITLTLHAGYVAKQQPPPHYAHAPCGLRR